MTKWTANDIPSQQGRSALVTGFGGLGYEDGLALAKAGAEVIMAGRNSERGAEAVARIRREAPAANVRFELLDLASLASVAELGQRLRDQRAGLDILINNAAVMTPPTRQETSDGFELQLGTNYLGHFALTAHLLPLLRQSRASRVVSLSSLAAVQGQIDFDDLNARRNYKPMTAYAQSKIACLMFALELQRRSEAGGWGVESLAAHPGISRTNLLLNAPGRSSTVGRVRSLLPFLFQPVAQGALPTLFAATAPQAKGGVYYGPDRLGGTRGHPTEAQIPPQALDLAVARKLFDVSEDLVQLRLG
ncbi:SDR family oxidoreductase [Brevundimonas sp. M20]|uniref:SDR family oxidoreductase n=1 Tax=Brevundimonas sp. M20 TaxID=2591463 RepID=UPI001146BE71|nr:SDR family oxidoreductase [Brevundimonas sp. M20]QDH73533.1 SDR family NAD(P)-dependent oxidoreductase [Brevundimonas sp. M20]